MRIHTIASTLLYIIALAAASHPASSAPKYREISTTSFSVEIPNLWKMKPNDKDCYQFSSPDKIRPDDYTLEVCSLDKNLDDAAYESGIFDKDDKGNWITIAGPGSSKTAEIISYDDWDGIQAIIDCGIGEPTTGFHAAAGDCYWAVVSNERRSLIVDTQGLYRDFGTIRRIIKSLRIK